MKRAVVLINIGTPDVPTPSAVRRFLGQFLRDPRVVDLNPIGWWPLLYGIILPLRSRRIAKKYQTIWRQQSPLLEYGQALASRLQERLFKIDPHCQVRLAMTYGEPSLARVWLALKAEGIEHVTLLPLFPQYSATTSGAAFDAWAEVMRREVHLPTVDWRGDYAAHPTYIKALADSVRAHEKKLGEHRFLVISFHGIPLRYAKQGDPYPQRCEATANALVNALGLGDEQWRLCYQSRFGKEPWLTPYTDQCLQQLPRDGVDAVTVICPSFACDCLETLEEIAGENRDRFLAAGGKRFDYVPALNDSPGHVCCLTALLHDETRPRSASSRREPGCRIEVHF